MEKINMTLIWAAITSTAGVIVWIFTTFAPASEVDYLKEEHAEMVRTSEFEQFSVEVFYGRFYELLEKRDRAEESGNDELVEEYERQMESLRVKICKVDPQWERC